MSPKLTTYSVEKRHTASSINARRREFIISFGGEFSILVYEAMNAPNEQSKID